MHDEGTLFNVAADSQKGEVTNPTLSDELVILLRKLIS